MHAALAMVDIAIVVCEPDPARANAVAPLLRALANELVPHIVLINKIDTFDGSVADVIAASAGLCGFAAGAAPDADHRRTAVSAATSIS